MTITTKRLEGKVALVTGAGSGIGEAIAHRFADDGATVIVVDINDVPAKTVANDIGPAAHAEVADVGDPESVRELIERVVAEHGRLDIAVNNAGIGGASAPVAEYPFESWRQVMSVNLDGVFYSMRYEIPAMLKNGGGSIINTASFVAKLGAATPQVAYTASKGAVLSMTRELAVIHARENIRVNALCPGPLRTPLLMSFLDTDAKRNRRLVHIPMGRFGEAAEIAKAALFLASDDSSYMTGAELLVDGGITAAYVTPE